MCCQSTAFCYSIDKSHLLSGAIIIALAQEDLIQIQ
jgi:hypothetical protein